MPAGYAATTQMDSILGDTIVGELHNLRVYEQPIPFGGGISFTREPSNVIRLGKPPGQEPSLGVDILFKGLQGMWPPPPVYDARVRFFLERLGAEPGEFDIIEAPVSVDLNVTTPQPLIFQMAAANYAALLPDSIYKLAAVVDIGVNGTPIVWMNGFIEGAPLSTR